MSTITMSADPTPTTGTPTLLGSSVAKFLMTTPKLLIELQVLNF
jgi:hypothetical protein